MSNLKNLVPCCIKVFKQKPDSEGYYIEPTKNQMIDELLEQHDELTKYKRAFEILKRNTTITLDKGKHEEEQIYCINIEQDYNQYVLFGLSKEEYELLEELMNCGTKDN